MRNWCTGILRRIGKMMRRFDTLQMELSGKKFDLQHLNFAAKSRNIRFALSTDGMNPFGENGIVNST
jgi:hypothetical protein